MFGIILPQKPTRVPNNQFIRDYDYGERLYRPGSQETLIGNSKYEVSQVYSSQGR